MTSPNSEQLTDTEVQLAAQQEENARLQNQIQYLNQRVVLLRALVNRAENAKNASAEETQEESNEDVAG